MPSCSDIRQSVNEPWCQSMRACMRETRGRTHNCMHWRGRSARERLPTKIQRRPFHADADTARLQIVQRRRCAQARLHGEYVGGVPVPPFGQKTIAVPFSPDVKFAQLRKRMPGTTPASTPSHR